MRRSPVEAAQQLSRALALIGKLLARPGISEDFREELEGYKQDIAAGAFEDRDHDYIRALHKRLSEGRFCESRFRFPGSPPRS